MSDLTTSNEQELSPVKVLSKTQRRVLGVLVEKGITTPEYYPMTLKALTAGCNQKNNRSPLTDYSEDDLTRAIDQLREMGLVAVVHTESGRTERYRHYVRKRFPFSEAQLAIMTELWLRGRQSLGDLRVRASRMTAIDSLDQLRAELHSLMNLQFVQANAPLTARGTEVDHTFYKPSENMTLPPATASAQESFDHGEESGIFRKDEAVPLNAEFPLNAPSPINRPTDGRLQTLEHSLAELQAENSTLRNRLQIAEQTLVRLTESIESLRRELGCAQ